jgi:acyl-CoA reductase-like NAD-dependent aldehyde dehydrogenase
VSIEAINPATGEVLGSYPEHRDHEISTILDEAHEAWESWRATVSSCAAPPRRFASGGAISRD